MSSITVIMEPSADGTLHLPVPAEWRHQAIRVKAELDPVADMATTAGFRGFGCLKGKIRMEADFDAPLEDFRDYMP